MVDDVDGQFRKRRSKTVVILASNFFRHFENDEQAGHGAVFLTFLCCEVFAKTRPLGTLTASRPLVTCSRVQIFSSESCGDNRCRPSLPRGNCRRYAHTWNSLRSSD